MEDFKPIETQEQFDTMIADRLKRERETITKKFSDYEMLKEKAENYDSAVADYEGKLQAANNKISDNEKIVKDMESKIAEYETSSVKMRIASKYGLPFEMAGRLNGNDEVTLRNDAETLAKMFVNTKITAPLRSTEVQRADTKDEAYRNMLKDIKEKE